MHLLISKHARERLIERYNITYDDIDPKELEELLEENCKYGIARGSDRVQVTMFYRGEMIKAIYAPETKVLITVLPHREARLKLDR